MKAEVNQAHCINLSPVAHLGRSLISAVRINSWRDTQVSEHLRR